MKLAYTLKRIYLFFPTLLGITILVYAIANLAPGNPLDFMIGPDTMMSDQEYKALQQQYGLNLPIYQQYLHWLGQIFHGNFGISFRTSEPVLTMILNRLGPTLVLTFSSVLISLLIAVPLGILAAVKPNSWLDYLATSISFGTAAIPNFFGALIVIYVFAVQMQLLPVGGMYTSSYEKTVANLLYHLFLPATVLSFQQIGGYLQQLRGSMLEVLQENYIRTAYAKGLISRHVIIRHALGNAIIPLITMLGMTLPFIVGGAVVTEQIFGWPGIGTLMILSIQARDYPCIMGITLFVSVAVLVGNLLTDIIYGLIDPRISYR